MLIGFPRIFVADIKIIYGYNFVAPLTNKLNQKIKGFLNTIIPAQLSETFFQLTTMYKYLKLITHDISNVG